MSQSPTKNKKTKQEQQTKRGKICVLFHRFPFALPNNRHIRELRGIVKHDTLSASYHILLHLPHSILMPHHTRELLIKGADESKSISGRHAQCPLIVQNATMRSKGHRTEPTCLLRWQPGQKGSGGPHIIVFFPLSNLLYPAQTLRQQII